MASLVVLSSCLDVWARPAAAAIVASTMTRDNALVAGVSASPPPKQLTFSDPAFTLASHLAQYVVVGPTGIATVNPAIARDPSLALTPRGSALVSDIQANVSIYNGLVSSGTVDDGPAGYDINVPALLSVLGQGRTQESPAPSEAPSPTEAPTPFGGPGPPLRATPAVEATASASPRATPEGTPSPPCILRSHLVWRTPTQLVISMNYCLARLLRGIITFPGIVAAAIGNIEVLFPGIATQVPLALRAVLNVLAAVLRPTAQALGTAYVTCALNPLTTGIALRVSLSLSPPPGVGGECAFDQGPGWIHDP